MSKTAQKKIFDLSLLRRVFHFVKPYNNAFYSSLFLAVALAFFSPVRPFLINITVKAATQSHYHIPPFIKAISSYQGNNSIGAFILNITIFQILFLLVETTMRFLFTFTTAWLGQHVIKDMRTTVFQKILSLNLRQFDTTPIGTLTTRTINDIESINDIFSDGLIPIVADLLTIIITLITMFWMNWQVALVCLLPFPFLIIATYYFKESVNKSFLIVRNAVAALNAFVQEHLTGMHVVQAFAAEERELNKFKKINAEHRDANIKAILAYSIFFPIVELVLAISTGLLVWWIADRRLDAGLLVAFILYLNQIFRPLRIIADKFNVIQMGMIAAERIFKVIDNPDVTPKKPVSQRIAAEVPLEKIPGSVEFKNVWFAYTDENYVLKDISFTINAGETVALVGQTGSGKTSIISLINRMYPLTKGTITIDGMKIEEYMIDDLRQHVGVVLQDVFLFSGSIMDNITLRNPAITREKVIQAAKLIDIDDFIMQFPGGYDYEVMERGNTMSLGQRQLISFIRALLYDPSILVLDEATSSIDTESEILVQKAMTQLTKGRTSIIIAHRLSTIKNADKIIVLDKGEIKEIGNHQELLAHKGYYEKLYRKQFAKSFAN